MYITRACLRNGESYVYVSSAETFALKYLNHIIVYAN